jgi:hypothetical protein
VNQVSRGVATKHGGGRRRPPTRIEPPPALTVAVLQGVLALTLASVRTLTPRSVRDDVIREFVLERQVAAVATRRGAGLVVENILLWGRADLTALR